MANRRIINHPELQSFQLLELKEIINVDVCFFMLDLCAEYNFNRFAGGFWTVSFVMELSAALLNMPAYFGSAIGNWFAGFLELFQYCSVQICSSEWNKGFLLQTKKFISLDIVELRSCCSLRLFSLHHHDCYR